MDWLKEQNIQSIYTMNYNLKEKLKEDIETLPVQQPFQSEQNLQFNEQYHNLENDITVTNLPPVEIKKKMFSNQQIINLYTDEEIETNEQIKEGMFVKKLDLQTEEKKFEEIKESEINEMTESECKQQAKRGASFKETMGNIYEEMGKTLDNIKINESPYQSSKLHESENQSEPSEKLIYTPETYNTQIDFKTNALQQFMAEEKVVKNPKFSSNRNNNLSTRNNNSSIKNNNYSNRSDFNTFKKNKIIHSPIYKSTSGIVLKKGTSKISPINMLKNFSRKDINNPHNLVSANGIGRSVRLSSHKTNPSLGYTPNKQLRNIRERIQTKSVDILASPLSNLRQDSLDRSIQVNRRNQAIGNKTNFFQPNRNSHKIDTKSLTRSFSNIDNSNRPSPHKSPYENFQRDKRYNRSFNLSRNIQNPRTSIVSQPNNILSFGNEHSREQEGFFNSQRENNIARSGNLRTVQSNLSHVMRNQQYNGHNNGNDQSYYNKNQDFQNNPLTNQSILDLQDVTQQYSQLQTTRSMRNYNSKEMSEQFYSKQRNGRPAMPYDEQPHQDFLNNSTYNIAQSVCVNPEATSISPEDLESRLVLLFRKSIVFSSKIDSLKGKIIKNNPDFSSYKIFRRFSGDHNTRMEGYGLQKFFETFGFDFGSEFVERIMIYLSKFKLGEKSGFAERMGGEVAGWQSNRKMSGEHVEESINGDALGWVQFLYYHLTRKEIDILIV